MWQSTMDPIMPPPDPYDLISLNPMAGNCRTIWQILQADSISTASIVYVPVNPTIPPPLEVMPNFTHFYIWHRRKSKAARRVGMDRFISNLQAFRRYIAAQCSLETVAKLLQPLGYELLFLEHFVAVLVHQRVVSLVRQHLGQPGTTPSTFEVWRQGWYCSPYSRYMDHLEVGVGFDATWLSPEPAGPSQKGLGCSRSFREFLAAEGHLISGSYTGKDVCEEELPSTSRSMAMQATQRRLRLLRGTASAGKGVASAEAMDMQPRANAAWCQHQLQSACACLPPFRGSDCYIVDQGERDKERPFRGALVYVLDRRSETLEAFLTNLRKLNALAGWEYPLIIFTADVLLQEKEKIILASENRVWFVQSQEANIAGSGMLQWFRHTHLFDHPGIAGLDILWDVTDADIVFKEDPLRNLQTKRAQAGCRRIEDVSARSGLRASQDAFLGDLTELFVQLSQATLAEGVHGAASACTVWKRTFMSEPLFRQYIQFLEDAVGGATEAALRFDALSVRNFGIELLHRQVRGTQLLLLE